MFKNDFGDASRIKIIILLLDETREEQEFSEGDFFLIPPGIPYTSKNAADTRIFFIKSPGGNDKTLIAIDEHTKKWLSRWDAE